MEPGCRAKHNSSQPDLYRSISASHLTMSASPLDSPSHSIQEEKTISCDRLDSLQSRSPRCYRGYSLHELNNLSSSYPVESSVCGSESLYSSENSLIQDFLDKNGEETATLRSVREFLTRNRQSQKNESRNKDAKRRENKIDPWKTPVNSDSKQYINEERNNNIQAHSDSSPSNESPLWRRLSNSRYQRQLKSRSVSSENGIYLDLRGGNNYDEVFDDSSQSFNTYSSLDRKDTHRRHDKYVDMSQVRQVQSVKSSMPAQKVTYKLETLRGGIENLAFSPSSPDLASENLGGSENINKSSRSHRKTKDKTSNEPPPALPPKNSGLLAKAPPPPAKKSTFPYAFVRSRLSNLPEDDTPLTSQAGSNVKFSRHVFMNNPHFIEKLKRDREVIDENERLRQLDGPSDEIIERKTLQAVADERKSTDSSLVCSSKYNKIDKQFKERFKESNRSECTRLYNSDLTLYGCDNKISLDTSDDRTDENKLNSTIQSEESSERYKKRQCISQHNFVESCNESIKSNRDEIDGRTSEKLKIKDERVNDTDSDSKNAMEHQYLELFEDPKPVEIVDTLKARRSGLKSDINKEYLELIATDKENAEQTPTSQKMRPCEKVSVIKRLRNLSLNSLDLYSSKTPVDKPRLSPTQEKSIKSHNNSFQDNPKNPRNATDRQLPCKEKSIVEPICSTPNVELQLRNENLENLRLPENNDMPLTPNTENSLGVSFLYNFKNRRKQNFLLLNDYKSQANNIAHTSNSPNISSHCTNSNVHLVQSNPTNPVLPVNMQPSANNVNVHNLPNVSQSLQNINLQSVHLNNCNYISSNESGYDSDSTTRQSAQHSPNSEHFNFDQHPSPPLLELDDYLSLPLYLNPISREGSRGDVSKDNSAMSVSNSQYGEVSNVRVFEGTESKSTDIYEDVSIPVARHEIILENSGELETNAPLLMKKTNLESDFNPDKHENYSFICFNQDSAKNQIVELTDVNSGENDYEYIFNFETKLPNPEETVEQGSKSQGDDIYENIEFKFSVSNYQEKTKADETIKNQDLLDESSPSIPVLETSSCSVPLLNKRVSKSNNELYLKIPSSNSKPAAQRKTSLDGHIDNRETKNHEQTNTADTISKDSPPKLPLRSVDSNFVSPSMQLFYKKVQSQQASETTATPCGTEDRSWDGKKAPHFTRNMFVKNLSARGESKR